MSMNSPFPPLPPGSRVEQIPFGGLTRDQVIRKMHGQEPDRPTIHKVYLRGRDTPLIVEGAASWDTENEEGWVMFYRDEDCSELIASFDADDVVAIFEPEPNKDRVI